MIYFPQALGVTYHCELLQELDIAYICLTLFSVDLLFQRNYKGERGQFKQKSMLKWAMYY